MTRLPETADSRITHDQPTGAIRSWFNPRFRPDAKRHASAPALARQVLSDSADLFHFARGLTDIAERAEIAAVAGSSIRFEQVFGRLPVYHSDIVVNIDAGGHLTSIYNGYHYDIPQHLDGQSARIDEAEARKIAQGHLPGHRGIEVLHAELTVYQYEHTTSATGKPGPDAAPRARALAQFTAAQAEAAAGGFRPRPGTYYLAWNVRLQTTTPRGAWRVMIDAISGETLNVIDLAQYETGTALVFDPNPIVTSGNTALRHNSAAASINAQRMSVTLTDLNAPSGGTSRLHGAFVVMAEDEAPTIAEPTSATAAFNYPWDDTSFLDAMAYFHLDRFQSYVQSALGITNAANYAISVDPQGLNGDDNSHYVPGGGGTGAIAFGGGIQPIPGSNPVPDAADGMVVLHEYGHAIQDNSNPGFDNPASGVGEGWGDTLAAVYYDDKHANPAATRGYMMSWDSEMGTGSWSGRRYDVTWLFDGPEYTAATGPSGDNHTAGQLWCATTFQLYRKLGGDSGYPAVKSAARDLLLRLHLQANFNVPTNGATAAQMGQQIEAADSNLGGWRTANGLHHKVIYDTFALRHLGGYAPKAVDVYINDGRQGGYGSLSGNDAFPERQWQDVWWETQDVWCKVTPYASAAAQQAGDPGDHQEPPVGSTAYLYVRVGNRGTAAAGSGPVTVRAFHADPGIGLTWPQDWMAMNTASLTIPNVLPGVANHVVVGPFPWTPTVVGHECVLAVVECANDRAVTQDLAGTDHVSDGDMVPFDNNIAQRNLNPTSAKAGGKYRFVVRNPFLHPGTLELQVTSTLPKGWSWHLPEQRMELQPGARTWVELTIDRASGAAVTTFETQHLVQIAGLLDGRPIGGISFYLAPPTAFPHHRSEDLDTCDATVRDLLSLDIPWRDCAIEGEIDIRVRFRKS